MDFSLVVNKLCKEHYKGSKRNCVYLECWQSLGCEILFSVRNSYENLSSNTFFHFTRSLENLEGILKRTFEPRYCLERSDYFSKRILKIELAFPMVCFCDIPLSKLKKHIGFYGDYGIGLSKKWGFKKNFSPIMYTRTGARTSNSFQKLIYWYNKNFENRESRNAKEFEVLMSDFLMFTKSYSGKILRNGEFKKVKFYDEREWRWIPRITKNNVWRHLVKEQYLDEEFRERANRSVARNYKLHFQPDDINYLIIRSEDEIDSFIMSLENIKGGFSTSTIKKLTSRIITQEQVMYDF